jgi:hypothetical protein
MGFVSLPHPAPSARENLFFDITVWRPECPILVWKYVKYAKTLYVKYVKYVEVLGRRRQFCSTKSTEVHTPVAKANLLN